MGSDSSKPTAKTTLSEDEISRLIKITTFSRLQILQYHAKFIVR